MTRTSLAHVMQASYAAALLPEKPYTWQGYWKVCIIEAETAMLLLQNATLPKVNTMQIEQIITALHNAKLYEAAKLQCDNINVDNLSMLVAVATGSAIKINDLFALYERIRS